jgi:hypothetical protein
METKHETLADRKVTSHGQAKELLGRLMWDFERTFRETGAYPLPSTPLVAAMRAAADLMSSLEPAPTAKFGSRKNMLY